ncbi:MAG TPA: DNA-3-methyladenine glycosylase I [bacterium]|nr:DNA-3-methyladenine glycosylase I [bacterium]
MTLKNRKTTLRRCPWPGNDDPLMLAYHDQEWGVPVHDDRKIFEFLVLEAFQAGLSWRTILHKRQNFRKAFRNFDYRKVARFGPKDQARLKRDAGIVRNRAKIKAAIENAKRFIEIRKEFGTFSKYMWSWVHGRPIRHKIKTLKDFPVVIPEAEAWAKDLKKRGFKFLGPTVVYAHMQAAGMVNDHSVNCFCRGDSK